MTAIFAARVAELPRLLDALQYHPDGLRIEDLAAEVGRTPEQVREALLTYYSTDLAEYDANLIGRPPAIEFVTGPSDDDLGRAHVVRLVAANPASSAWHTCPSRSWPGCIAPGGTGCSSSRATRFSVRPWRSSVMGCYPA